MITIKPTTARWCAIWIGVLLSVSMAVPASAAISISITNFRGVWDSTVTMRRGSGCHVQRSDVYRDYQE